MKRILSVFFVLFLLIAAFVFHIFSSTGFFRKIENKVADEVYKFIPLHGVEDIAIASDNHFLILSAFDRAAKRNGLNPKGHLYKINLNDPDFEPERLTESLTFDLEPHGISLLMIDSMKYRVLVINHANDIHSIEVFDLENGVLNHLETHMNKLIVSPNDVVAITKDQYYFTNDHRYTKGIGKLAEDYLGIAISNVVYFDGSQFRIVAGGISYANGINTDRSRDLIYVAAVRGFEIRVYQKAQNGDLMLVDAINAGSGVDNIEVDDTGALWIGCHPSLLAFSAYASGKKEKAPSEILRIKFNSNDDYTLESVFVDDGSLISGSTIAIPYKNFLFLGNVMDDHVLVLKSN